MSRYSRHLVLPEIGEEGQERLRNSSVAVLGLGSLGSAMAESLTRTGIGKIRIVDRDYVEISNLNHQILYDESDIGRPKADAANHRLKEINSDVDIEKKVKDIGPQNIEGLIEDVDIVLDATDNMKTRYIINDACVKKNVPWIYTAVLGTYGMSLNVHEEGPCLKCMLAERPKPGTLETCETAGVLFTLPRTMGNLAATEAVKFLTGDEMREGLLTFDIWKSQYDPIKAAKREDCECCVKRNFTHLSAPEDSTTELCGKNAVQVSPAEEFELDLNKVASRFDEEDIEMTSESMLTVDLEDHILRIFRDGRAMIEGTEDPKRAKSIYSRYIGE